MTAVRLPIALLLMTCLLLLATQSARADYVITGKLQYQDLELDFSQGFSGVRNDRPVRYADLALIVGGFITATGATDENGDFSLAVTTAVPQDIQLVAITTSEATAELNIQVVTFVNGNGIGTPHALQLYTETAHDPTTDINVGTIVADYHAGGDQFNLFDIAVDATRFLTNVLGENAPPGSPSLLTIEFTYNPNGTGFAFYNGISVNLDGAYGYDDTIALHEIGHWVQDRFGDFSDNPGGQHFIGDNAQDPRLSFGEGWPTFFGSNVRLYYYETTGNTSAYRQPSMYMNSNGSINGGQGFSYDLEASGGSGAANENVVQALMWDLVDNPSTPDFSPGLDDEDPSFAMDRTFLEAWEFVTTNLSQPPFSGQLTYEDWYDLWVANQPNPETQRYQALQTTLHRIEYFADANEPNNDLASATVIQQAQFNALLHNTTWPEGDQDWFRFQAVQDVQYTISTLNMLDGADTFMRLYDPSSDLLASNDNIGAIGGPPNALEALRSQIIWTAPADGFYFIQIDRSIFNTGSGGGTVSKYGNWNIQFSISDVPETFAALQAFPGNIAVLLANNQTLSRDLRISNTGTQQDLTYTISEYDQDSGSTTDFSWLSASPVSGTVAAGTSDTIAVTFNTGEFSADTLINKRLRIQSNDLLQPNKDIIIVLRVDVPTGIGDDPESSIPQSYSLEQNYPNPFNPETTIRYSLPVAGSVRVEVFNLLGQRVRQLVDQQQTAGSYTVSWDGRDDSGIAVPSGLYLYRLQSATFSGSRKMILLK